MGAACESMNIEDEKDLEKNLHHHQDSYCPMSK